VLRYLPRPQGPDVLVDYATSDDAAVYRLGPDQAIVETVDFFTPVVDDPFLFGRIAAANALSDIWAMGAKPLFALNIVGFPVGKLPMEVLGEILRGGGDAAAEAGVPILGGHSIDDPEPKYGLVVTGLVHPERVLKNVGARPGDRLVLTKPLGSGIATTALKRGLADPDLIRRASAVMAALNKKAGEILAESGAVNALTDVTGFGLLGHAWEMAHGSGVAFRLRLAAIPILDGVLALARRDVVPGGSRANLTFVAPHVAFDAGVDEATRLVLADAQTNGGLLAALPSGRSEAVCSALVRGGVDAVEIGEVAAGEARLEVVAG
jgi:selenide, water dikinase